MLTVAAVSTPRGKGGVALIRISGDNALEVAEGCFAAQSRRGLSSYPPRTAVFGRIFSPSQKINAAKDADRVPNGVFCQSEPDFDGGIPVDEAVAVYYAAPRSYTGEDVVELCCHGGVAVTRAALEAVFAAGAYPAGPGDFTRRAFINGKLSLTEAEAVGRLIDADTEARRRLAYRNLNGAVSRELESVRASLTSALAKLYAVIDYPDEELGGDGADELAHALNDTAGRLDRLSRSYRVGRAVADGVRTVICGSPNVGKSSLFNLLAGDERAIVTDIPGTTRDYLETAVTVGGVTLLLCDTAGLRGDTAADEVERAGISRSYEKIDEAELLLYVYDASDTSETSRMGGAELINKAKERGVPVLLIANKADLITPPSIICDGEIYISAKTGEGIDRLDGAVAALFADGIDTENGAVVCEARQSASIARASAAVNEALNALSDGFGADIVGTLAENAMRELDLTDGRDVNGEIVDEIFARFCVGK